jgi:hypothetical protein
MSNSGSGGGVIGHILLSGLVFLPRVEASVHDLVAGGAPLVFELGQRGVLVPVDSAADGFQRIERFSEPLERISRLGGFDEDRRRFAVVLNGVRLLCGRGESLVMVSLDRRCRWIAREAG